jgi:hypothetical protein
MKTLLSMSAVLLLSGLTAGCVEELSTAHGNATNQKQPMKVESNQQQPMNWCNTKQDVTSRQKCEDLMAYSSH